MTRIKAPRLLWLFFGVAVFMIVGSVVAISARYLTRQDRLTRTASACVAGSYDVHSVIIQYGKVLPAHTTALQCDTLTIVNMDSTKRLMAFGLHEAHVPYDGVGEKLLAQGQSLTVTLRQPGEFRFHDHLDDAVQGTFTVKAR